MSGHIPSTRRILNDPSLLALPEPPKIFA